LYIETAKKIHAIARHNLEAISDEFNKLYVNAEEPVAPVCVAVKLRNVNVLDSGPVDNKSGGRQAALAKRTSSDDRGIKTETRDAGQ